jgi:hypothetical protein
MHISKMKSSRFLKTSDVDPEVLITIQKVDSDVVDEDSHEEKYVLYTHEFDKPLVLNWTNIQLIANAVGSEDTDNWPGHQVVLYHDETVSFRGQVVGGIRVRRAPKQKRRPVARKQDPDDPLPDLSDDEEAAA